MNIKRKEINISTFPSNNPFLNYKYKKYFLENLDNIILPANPPNIDPIGSTPWIKL